MDARIKFSPLTDAEFFSYHLECGINALDAIHVAMSEGPFAEGDFVNALYFVRWYLGECQQGLQDAIEKLHKEDT